MEGPFRPIRNKFERTPLERIRKNIEEATKEIAIEKQNLKEVIKKEESANIQSKITDIMKTIEILKIEQKNREIKENNLRKKRKILINEISDLREKQNKLKSNINVNKKIQELIKEVELTDEDLGPFRYSNDIFYLD